VRDGAKRAEAGGCDDRAAAIMGRRILALRRTQDTRCDHCGDVTELTAPEQSLVAESGVLFEHFHLRREATLT
jgi:hypothetical protein